jgi:hypothetical protein
MKNLGTIFKTLFLAVLCMQVCTETFSPPKGQTYKLYDVSANLLFGDQQFDVSYGVKVT